LNIIINIIALVVLAILVYNGFKYVHIMRRQQMPSIHAPIAIMYLSLPVGLGAICIMTVIYIINLIHRFIHPEAEENKTGSLT
jgi:TRAP-type C4-dicarboxylate transport system permease small subunit